MIHIKELKIYLAGKMGGISFNEMNQWRKEISILLKTTAKYAEYKVNIINPVDFFNFEEKLQKTELEVMNYDLRHVETSNIIIVNLYGLSSSIGSSIEIYRAYQLGIPVFAFGKYNDYLNLHPWVQCCITRCENNIDDIIGYVRKFYMI